MVNYTLLHCRLVNSTSETTFNFTNGLQAISSEITYVKAASTVQSVHTTCSNVTISGKDRRISGYNCHASDRACFYNPDFFQTLSYQAIMDAFTRQITGRTALSVAAKSIDSSNVVDTVLVQTSDLAKTAQATTVQGGGSLSLEWLLTTQALFDKPEYHGLINKDYAKLGLDLQNTIEQLFQNVTVSMMTSTALQ
jgi:hypothetical protein